MKFFLLLLIFSQTDEIDAQRTQLERMKKELEEGRRKIAQMESRMKTTEEELVRIKKQEDEINRFVSKLNKDIQTIQNEIARLEIMVDQKEKELFQHASRIKFSLNLLYLEVPENDLLRFLPAREEDKEAIFLLDHVIQSEKKEREKALRIYNELKAYRELKNDNLEFVKTAKIEVENQQKNLERLKKQRENMLASLKEQKVKEEKRLAELEKAIKEMQALIARLEREQEKRRAAEHVVAKSPTGKYPWPVKGRIVLEYGTIVNPKYGTKIFNPGIDIEADPGAPVVCIDDGAVIFVGKVTGYGNTVIVDHGGFFSVYAYLASTNVATGSKVKRGQVIGNVGTIDHYFGSKLHFEIRDKGKSVNPLTYLK